MKCERNQTEFGLEDGRWAGCYGEIAVCFVQNAERSHRILLKVQS